MPGGQYRYRKHRKRAFNQQGGLCFWCGGHMLRSNEGGVQGHRMQCTADHLVPQSQDGGDEGYNIVASCANCNIARANQSVTDWLVRCKLRLQSFNNQDHFPVLLKWLGDYGIHVASATPCLGPDGQNPLTVPPLKDAEPAP